MSIASIYNSFGFHTINSVMSFLPPNERNNIPQNEIKELGTAVKIQNALMVSGYFPLIGAYMGYKRVSMNVKNDCKDPVSVRIVEVIRGILEILCLGILFLIPDLLVSFHRHVCTTTPAEQKI